MRGKGEQTLDTEQPRVDDTEGRWAVEQDMGFEPGSPGRWAPGSSARHVAMSTYPRPLPRVMKEQRAWGHTAEGAGRSTAAARNAASRGR